MQMRLLVFVFIAAVFSACTNTDASKIDTAKAATDSANFTNIQWIDSVQNLPRINQGQKLDVVYHFKNTGVKPLVIIDVRPGCGCTVADKPGEPIMPGKEGQIKASFDSEGKQGPQHKVINILANTQPTQNFTLEFNVEVEKKS